MKTRGTILNTVYHHRYSFTFSSNIQHTYFYTNRETREVQTRSVQFSLFLVTSPSVVLFPLLFSHLLVSFSFSQKKVKEKESRDVKVFLSFFFLCFFLSSSCKYYFQCIKRWWQDQKWDQRLSNRERDQQDHTVWIPFFHKMKRTLLETFKSWLGL